MVKLECKVSVFRNLIDSISKTVTDVVFVFSKKGVKLQCMDSNHVGLIMLSLPKSTFIRYNCPNEEKLSFSLDSFLKILNCASSKDDCTISYKTGDDHLLIEFTNDSRSFEYSMKLLEIEYKPIDIPPRDDDVVIVFPSADYQNLVKDLSALGTEVYIAADSDSINFSVESDVGKGTYTIEYQDDGVECKEFEEECSQLFSLKYLGNFSKPCGFCDKVEIRMKDSNPLIIRFPLPKMSDCLINLDDDTNYGILLFFLAPKIEE